MYYPEKKKKQKNEYVGDDILDLDEVEYQEKKGLTAIRLSEEEYQKYKNKKDSIADDILD